MSFAPSMLSRAGRSGRAGGAARTRPFPAALPFDSEADAAQEDPIVDDAVEPWMCELLVEWLRASAAPSEQFERLRPLAAGPVEEAHLLTRRQHATAVAATLPEDRRTGLGAPARELLAEVVTAGIAEPCEDDSPSPLQHVQARTRVLSATDLAADLAA